MAFDAPPIAELKHRCFIQAPSTAMTRDADGHEARQSDSNWPTFTSAWMKIDTSGGREFFGAKSVNPELTHELVMLWQPGITPSMRVYYPDPKRGSGDRYFDIKAVIVPDETTMWLVLHCKELVGQKAVV